MFSRKSISKFRQDLIHKILGFFQTSPRNHRDIKNLLNAIADRGLLPKEICDIMSRTAQAETKRVRDIMIVRPKMAVLNKEDMLSDWVQEIVQSKHSRYPVIDTKLDDVVGIILVKDLLVNMHDRTEIDSKSMKQLLRKPVCVPESQQVYTLLAQFRRERSHMAIVLDEYGGTVGLVTLEDALEELIGEIEDEHDPGEEDLKKMIRPENDNNWWVDALTPLDDFKRHFKLTLRNNRHETIGGWLANELKHIPKNKDTWNNDAFIIKVIKAQKRRAEELRVTLKQKNSAKQ